MEEQYTVSPLDSQSERPLVCFDFWPLTANIGFRPGIRKKVYDPAAVIAEYPQRVRKSSFEIDCIDGFLKSPIPLKGNKYRL